MCGECWLNHGDPFNCRCRVWEDPIEAIKDAQKKANRWKRPYALIVRAGAYRVVPLTDDTGETLEVIWPTVPLTPRARKPAQMAAQGG